MEEMEGVVAEYSFFLCNHRSEERRMETVHDTLSNLFLKKIENTKINNIYILHIYIFFIDW